MNMQRLVSTIIAGFAASFPAMVTAQPDCQPEFVRTAQSVNVTNIVVGRSPERVENFQINVRNAGDPNADCPVTLRFARFGGSVSVDGSPYTLRRAERVIEILPSDTFPGTGTSDVAVAQLPPSSNGLSVPFRLVIPSAWGAESGTRVEELVVLLIDDDLNVVDRLLLTVVLDFPPSVELRIVGATGEGKLARVDMGRMDSDDTTRSDPFGIRVWSTSAYTVSFRSENMGRLVTDNNSGSIDYQLLLEGIEVKTSGIPALSVPKKTDALGDFHGLEVVVPPFRSKAGDYSDRIEVTVSAI